MIRLARRLLGTAICLALWPLVPTYRRIEIRAELAKLWTRRNHRA